MPEKDPTTWGMATWLLALGMAFGGGAAGTELSAEASEFLLEFAREADRAAEYANTCHRWIEEVNGRR